MSNLLNQINIDQNTDPNLNYGVIEDVLFAAQLKHVSRKRVNFNKFQHKKTEWITKGIIRSIKRRDELYREFKKTPTDSSNYEARKINLRTYNVIIKRSIFIAKKTYYHHIFQKYSSDIKNTWSIITNILHKKKKSNLLPNKIKINNILNENIEVITNSFNKYFVNIGPDLASNIKDPTPNSYKTFLKNPASSRFSFELVNENTVSKIMDNLSTKKSRGIDELSTHLIKSIKSEILGPLTITINQSLVTGIFPDKLKIAKVTPIFKKGEPTVIENYRPISLIKSF